MRRVLNNANPKCYSIIMKLMQQFRKNYDDIIKMLCYATVVVNF
jgi:hypothetical protein